MAFVRLAYGIFCHLLGSFTGKQRGKGDATLEEALHRRGHDKKKMTLDGVTTNTPGAPIG